jgi:hypothetical protein
VVECDTYSGTTTTESDTLSASAAISGMPAGTYTGTITVAAVGVTTKAIPVTMTLAAAMPAGTETLSWTANTETDVAGYKIYRGTASGTYGTPIATVSQPATSYTVSGLQTGTTYFFPVYTDLARYAKEALRGTGLDHADTWGPCDPVELIDPHDPIDETVATFLYRVSHVITAFDTAGNESLFSNEVTKSVY